MCEPDLGELPDLLTVRAEEDPPKPRVVDEHAVAPPSLRGKQRNSKLPEVEVDLASDPLVEASVPLHSQDPDPLRVTPKGINPLDRTPPILTHIHKLLSIRLIGEDGTQVHLIIEDQLLRSELVVLVATSIDASQDTITLVFQDLLSELPTKPLDPDPTLVLDTLLPRLGATAPPPTLVQALLVLVLSFGVFPKFALSPLGSD